MPARAVDDDADARFVEDDLADESTLGIGTHFGMCVSVAYRGPGHGSDVSQEGILLK